MKQSLGSDHRRKRAIETALVHLGNGGTPQEAAIMAGVKYKSLWRWLKQVGQNGGDIEAVAKGKPTGRPPVARLTEEEALGVKARIKNGMSEIMALRLACHEGEIRAEVASLIVNRKRKHDIPGVIRRQIKVADAVRTYHHSPRDFRLKHMSTPRRNVTIENGVETPDEPGDAFVSDDMTVNFAWWTPWPFADCECSKKWGVKVTRGQLLATIDLASMKFIHFSLLVRNGESYQSNDIWAEYGRIFRSIGLPRKEIIHEGGHWEAKHIHGQQIAGADEGLRTGGLAKLGVKATRSYTPKTKPIESRFNVLQRAMESLPGNLGRKREGTKEWKIYNRCATGALDPREHLPSQTQIADKIQYLMGFVNVQPIDNRNGATPDSLWNAALELRPLALPPREMNWIFARDARLRKIPAKGPISCRFKQANGDQKLYFDHTVFAFVPKKFQVMVHFDPLETAGEAVIVSADARAFDLPPMEGEPSRTIQTGDVLCVARQTFASARRTDEPDENLQTAREKVKAVKTESRRIDSNKSRATKMAEAYDGFGNAARLEMNGDGQSGATPLLRPRPRRAPAVPALSSRAMPADPRAEIARLQAELLGQD